MYSAISKDVQFLRAYTGRILVRMEYAPDGQQSAEYFKQAVGKLSSPFSLRK